MKVEAHLNINGSKQEVWKAITDIRNASEIIKGIEKIEIISEPANGILGLKWRETRMYFGKPSAIDKLITDAVENESYKTKAVMDGFIFLTTLTISELGNRVSLSSSHETKSQGVIAKIKSLPMIFFKGILKKAILQDLNDIKLAVENK
jgi:hypothetical protein